MNSRCSDLTAGALAVGYIIISSRGEIRGFSLDNISRKYYHKYRRQQAKITKTVGKGKYYVKERK